MVALFSAYVAIAGIAYALYIGYMVRRDETQLSDEHGIELPKDLARRPIGHEMQAPSVNLHHARS